MLHYILQVVAFQALFLIIYDVFLRKETFFNLNRTYLLVTAGLSVVIPFIKIEQIKTAVAKDFVIPLPEVIIGNVSENVGTIDPQIALQAGINLAPQPVSIWTIILITGMSIATLILILKITKLFWLVYQHPREWKNDVLIVNLIHSTKAFSFFHYIFLGGNLKPQEKSSILEHEIVHVQQKHTLDLLFFELFRIAFWFNPLVYIYQNRIATLHEYIADAKAVKTQNKAEYYDNLLAQVFETQQFSFVNPFFKHSLIKKRILMLSKSKSKQINMIKYVLLIPMVFTMLIYTSSYAMEKKVEVTANDLTEERQELTDKELFDKYYYEIVDLDKKGTNLSEIFQTYSEPTDNYILSRHQLFKKKAFYKFVFGKRKKDLKEDDIINKNDEKLSKLYSRFDSYKDYLEFKKTDEAKTIWENNIRDGVLRLVVTDGGNMTLEEKKDLDKKLDLVEKDEYYKSVLVATLDGRSKMMFSDVKSKLPLNTGEEVEIVEVEDITIDEQEVEVPFAIIEEVPTFSFCDEFTSQEERKKCMSDNVAKHVSKNFNTKLAIDLGLEGRQRINVMFKIDKEGHITGARARAPHPKLEEEALRVINSLPQFIPGKQKGKAVIVPYSLPIVFQVQGDAKSNEDKSSDSDAVEKVKEMVREQVKEQQELKEIPYSVVSEVPYYNICKDLKSNDDRKKCASKEVSYFVNRNFNINLASKLGLKGRQRILVIFKIDTSGRIIDVNARAPHPELEKEAIRVVRSLPKFDVPGKHDGMPVVVPYSLPIVFQIAPDATKEKKN